MDWIVWLVVIIVVVAVVWWLLNRNKSRASGADAASGIDAEIRTSPGPSAGSTTDGRRPDRPVRRRLPALRRWQVLRRPWPRPRQRRRLSRLRPPGTLPAHAGAPETRQSPAAGTAPAAAAGGVPRMRPGRHPPGTMPSGRPSGPRLPRRRMRMAPRLTLTRPEAHTLRRRRPNLERLRSRPPRATRSTTPNTPSPTRRPCRERNRPPRNRSRTRTPHRCRCRALRCT